SMGQLADGSGLARAVDAGDHHHQRAGAPQVERPLERPQVVGQDLAQRRLDLGGILDAFLAHAGAQGGQQLLGGLEPGVGHDQRRFELLEQVLVDLDAHEQAAQALAGARQALLEPPQPGSLPGRLGGGGRGRRGLRRNDRLGLRLRRGHGGLDRRGLGRLGGLDRRRRGRRGRRRLRGRRLAGGRLDRGGGAARVGLGRRGGAVGRRFYGRRGVRRRRGIGLRGGGRRGFFFLEEAEHGRKYIPPGGRAPPGRL